MTHRTRPPAAAILARLLVAVAIGGATASVPAHQAQPHRKGGQTPLEFRGPGREDPEPDAAEVVIGWFGPGDPDHPEFGTLWRGATLALDEANAGGGYVRTRRDGDPPRPAAPFRLVPAWSESPWQAGIADLTRIVHEHHVWAVIGGVDGTTTHLAVQIALKSHFLLLSPGSTDVSADRANVPWLFSLPPSDEAMAAVLVRALADASGEGACAILAASDHSSHASLTAVRRELSRQRVTPAALVEIDPADPDVRGVTTHVLERGPKAVLVLASAPLAGRLVGALRRSGFTGAIVGGPTAAGSAFRRAAGDAADGVLAPVSIERGGSWDMFAAAYEQRWGEAPDEAAANAYDAVKLVAAAICRAGLNRPRIRDAVRALAPWPGAGGPVAWNAFGRGQRAVTLWRWTAGRLAPLDTAGEQGRVPM